MKNFRSNARAAQKPTGWKISELVYKVKVKTIDSTKITTENTAIKILYLNDKDQGFAKQNAMKQKTCTDTFF